MVNLAKLTAAAVAALVSAGPAFAHFHVEWDADSDGALTLEEFQAGFTARVNLMDWDADADGLISEAEFGGGIYDAYDLDDTGAFEEAEFAGIEEDFGEGAIWRYRGEELVEAPGDEVAEGEVLEEGVEDVEIVDSEGAEALEQGVFTLEAWDIDGDGVILREEFDQGFADWGTFATFDTDADGFVTEDEFVAEIFVSYDDDFDGIIEEPELTDIGDDMGDEGFWDV